MYTTRWCAYCVRAKALLDARGLEYEEISLDDDPEFRQRLLDLTGSWTVPQILIDGRPIGGYTELWQLDRGRARADRGLKPRTARGTRRAGLAPPFRYRPHFPYAWVSPLVSHSKPVALRRVSSVFRGVPGQAQRWQDGQYDVPRPPARIFSIGVPQRSHGSPSRP